MTRSYNRELRVCIFESAELTNGFAYILFFDKGKRKELRDITIAHREIRLQNIPQYQCASMQKCNISSKSTLFAGFLTTITTTMTQ